MAITDFPWFRVYAADTLSDENFAAWGPAERGAWFTLLCHCWKEGSIPSDPSKLARLCGSDARAFPELWSSISHRFQNGVDPSRLVSLRLEFERQKSLEEAKAKTEHAKKGANAKWAKYKKDMPEHCPSIAQGVPNDATKPKPQPLSNTPLPPKGETSPSAPSIVRKRKPVNGSTLEVIKSPRDRDVFQILWEEWPREREGKPARGEKPKAQTCFQSILDGGEVSAEELLQAARIYISEDGRVKAGYPKMVSSWLALKDGFWKQCVQTIRARSVEAM